MCNEYLPTAYSGLPLGVKQNFVQVWDRVEERFHKRLALWKKKCISKGVSLTLIKNTLSDMPIYIMSLLCLPRGVNSILEKIQRDFL